MPRWRAISSSHVGRYLHVRQRDVLRIRNVTWPPSRHLSRLSRSITALSRFKLQTRQQVGSSYSNQTYHEGSTMKPRTGGLVSESSAVKEEKQG